MREHASAFWLGERYDNLLLGYAEIIRDGSSGRSHYFAYNDCASFRASDCRRELQLQVVSVCSRRSVLAGFDRPGFLRLGRSFARRGVLFADLGRAHAYVITGGASVTIFMESDPGPARPQLLAAVRALRPVGRQSSRTPPAPALPRALLRKLDRTDRTDRAYRRRGSVEAAARALGASPDQVRRRLRVARAVDALPRVRALACPRR